jgi:DNA polymerase-3 subunit beta
MIDRSQFFSSVRRAIFSNKTTQIRLKIAGAELNVSAEDIDYSNKAEERLTCDYQGDDMQIGYNSRFLTEMLTNLQSDMIMLEMSLRKQSWNLLS